MNENNLSPDDERLTRWIDGALDDGQSRAFEADLSRHPDRAGIERQRTETVTLGRLLREHVPTDVEPPFSDFFNSQILKTIRGEAAPVGAASPREAFLSSFLGWLRSPWAGATAAAAALVLVGLMAFGSRDDRTRVLSVYSPEPEAVARTYYSRPAHAVVIDVDRLPVYPADRTIVGNNGSDSATLVAILGN